MCIDTDNKFHKNVEDFWQQDPTSLMHGWKIIENYKTFNTHLKKTIEGRNWMKSFSLQHNETTFFFYKRPF